MNIEALMHEQIIVLGVCAGFAVGAAASGNAKNCRIRVNTLIL